MFGWEFPPLMAGGLGVACHGIISSLSKQNTQIHFVLPKDPGAKPIPNCRIFSVEDWEKNIDEATWKLNNSQCNYYYDAYSNSSYQAPFLQKQAPGEYTPIQSILYSKPLQGQSSLPIYSGNLVDHVHKYNHTAGTVASNLDFDIIHCHDWLTIGAGIITKQRTGKPLVFHIHATEYDRCPGYGNHVVHELERQGCIIADKVIAVSNLTKQVIIKKYGIDPTKIEVVHNGLNPPEAYPEPKQFTNHSPKILFLGRVTYQKGPNYFIEAAHKVLQVRPDAEFIVAGTGDMVDYLKQRCTELNIHDKVRFLGAISADKVKDIYSTVDCFILSSVSEPFGLTVLEALSQRLPVIVSKQSGVAEVLRHILRYDFWDIDKLTELILSIITYQPLAQELKEKSIDDLKPITWDQSALNLTTIYNQLSTK